MKRVVIFFFFALLPGFLFFAVPDVFAATPSTLSLSFTPTTPTAGEAIVATVEGTNFPKETATYHWYWNGVELVQYAGVGKTSAAIITDGASPGTFPLRVTVIPADLTFNPGEATLLITTTPSTGSPGDAITSDFSLVASDQSPSPGSPVTVSVETFAFDKDAASYAWTVNGVTQNTASGPGRSTFTFNAGANGVSSKIGVSVTNAAGKTKTKSITVKSLGLGFYWWATTTVPPWYRGKALPSDGSKVHVIALPSANSSAFTYQWRVNDDPVPDASGRGKNVFSSLLSLGLSDTISVDIRDLASGARKSLSTKIVPFRPFARMYHETPGGEFIPTALTTYSGASGASYQFRAEPFFFPDASVLKYQWTLDGKQINGTFVDPQEFTVNVPQGGVFQNSLNVFISDTKRPSASTNQSLSLSFQ